MKKMFACALLVLTMFTFVPQVAAAKFSETTTLRFLKEDGNFERMEVFSALRSEALPGISGYTFRLRYWSVSNTYRIPTSGEAKNLQKKYEDWSEWSVWIDVRHKGRTVAVFTGALENKFDEFVLEGRAAYDDPSHLRASRNALKKAFTKAIQKVWELQRNQAARR